METILQYGVLVGVAIVFLIICYVFLGKKEAPKKQVVNNNIEPLKKEKKVIDYGSIYYDAKKREEERKKSGVTRLEEAMKKEHVAVKEAIDAAEATIDWHHEKPDIRLRTKEELAKEALRIVSLQSGVPVERLTEDESEVKVEIPPATAVVDFDEMAETKIMPVITEEMIQAQVKKEPVKPNVYGLEAYEFTYGKADRDDLDALEEITNKVCVELGLKNQEELAEIIDAKPIEKAFMNMQRAYVLTKTNWMLVLAVLCFVGIAKQPRYKAFYIVLEKTLGLLPSVDEEQLSALVAVLVVKHIWDKRGYSRDEFVKYIETYLAPFIDSVPLDSKVYEVLERMNCIELVKKEVPFTELVGANNESIKQASRTISTLVELYESTLLSQAELTCIGLYLSEGYMNVMLEEK